MRVEASLFEPVAPIVPLHEARFTPKNSIARNAGAFEIDGRGRFPARHALVARLARGLEYRAFRRNATTPSTTRTIDWGCVTTFSRSFFSCSVGLRGRGLAMQMALKRHISQDLASRRAWCVTRRAEYLRAFCDHPKDRRKILNSLARVAELPRLHTCHRPLGCGTTEAGLDFFG
jgi:hypothetical protein